MSHTTHSACAEVMERDGPKAVGCCCTGHECRTALSTAQSYPTDMWGPSDQKTVPLVVGANDATLRTAASQLAYAQAEKGDISKETYQNIGGLKIVENGYPYDMVYKDNDMLLGQDGMDFWTFWVKLGQLIDDGKLDSYDQIILNSPSKQSQPHVKHVHAVRFKPRSEFEL